MQRKLLQKISMVLFFFLPFVYSVMHSQKSEALIYTESFPIKLNAREALSKAAKEEEIKSLSEKRQMQGLRNDENRSLLLINKNSATPTQTENTTIEKIITEIPALKQKKLELRSVDKSKAKQLRNLDNEKGIWVNVWNYPNNIESFMARQKKFNINTIYLQINRSTTPVFEHKEQLDAILKSAHKNNIKIIGWSYCYLKKIKEDAKKFIEPALYVSPDGESLDGMAADIEENTSESAVSEYTDLIKEALPNSYPIRAIVFAPEIKSHYPWKYIADNWDVLMPMAYWHGYKKRGKEVDVFAFIKNNIEKLKELTGKENLKIHLITDGELSTPEEVLESLKAAREFKVNAGISIYPEHLASDAILKILSDF